MSYLLFQNSNCCRTFSFPCVNAFDTLFEHLDIIVHVFEQNSMHILLELETQNNLDNKQIGDDLEHNSKVYVVDKNWYTDIYIYI
jgi:hypothetical protein